MLILRNLANLYDDDESDGGSGWISWFCDLEGHEFFIEVNLFQHYLKLFDRWMKSISEIISTCTDSENESNISSKSTEFHTLTPSNFSEAMQMILSADSPDSDDLNDQK